jgi:aminopeptidase N
MTPRFLVRRIQSQCASILSARCTASLVALGALLLLAVPAVLAAPEKPTIQVNSYVIDAEIDPASHKLTATATVGFSALTDLDVAAFQLHGALRVEKVTDAGGKTLNGERGQDTSVQVTLAKPMAKGDTSTLVFTYSGMLKGTDGSPVEGLSVASVGDPITYLLYAGRWFPMVGYMTNRFTADMHIKIPAGYMVIGTGSTGAPKPSDGGGEEWDFHWDKPGFPGTIIAGKFDKGAITGGASNIKVFAIADHKEAAHDFVEMANREFAFFTSTFGLPQSSRLNVVELPDDTVPAYFAPEIAAIAASRMANNRNSERLLANTIAHQWWGSEISPATLNDAWITNGMSRYGELMYLEDTAGKGALSSAVTDVSAGALAYDTIPLTSAGRFDAFSPEFQSMTLEKGAMVFHMLRWEVGDDNFVKILRGALSQYTGKGIRTSDFEKVAEAQSQQQLTPFFAQWLDGTGAPQFTDKYTVYRLGNNKGFRTIGQIEQDLDLFHMPVELRVETDGKTEIKRVDVVGTDSQYVVDTFGRPRHISIDPDNWLLKNTPDMQVRVSILRGQQLVAQGDFPGAIGEYQKALTANPNSSLANYRIGEVLFTQRNYQASVNAYRDALRGDNDPKWIEVWAHIQIGKIYDVTGQRDRAVQEYRQAVQTNDNTQGALNEARHLLQTPYKRDDSNE